MCVMSNLQLSSAVSFKFTTLKKKSVINIIISKSLLLLTCDDQEQWRI